MKIGIIDCDSGNLHSVQNSVAFAAQQMRSSAQINLVCKADDLPLCDYIILPGVGHFAACRAGLYQIDGIDEALHEAVINKAKPFLGICVGMQLLADEGYEGGKKIPGLGWIKGAVCHFTDCDKKISNKLKIPHIGWNELQIRDKTHPLCAELIAMIQMYFVHSYVFNCEAEANILATTDYGFDFPSLIGRDNIVGCQFHPEKSQQAGQNLLQAFLKWKP